LPLLALLTLTLIVFRKKIFLTIFMFTFPLFEKHQALGEALGVQYRESEEWSTNRKSSGLLIFQPSFMAKITGFSLKLGDVEFIKSFKHRQRNPVSPFTINIEKGERSLAELENELIKVWHFQLKECYQLPIEDDDVMIQVMINRRKYLSRGGLARLKMYVDTVFSRRGLYDQMKHAMRNMSDEEKTLYMIPFLTTLDTFMICLSFKTFGNELSDFFDRVPIPYVPMYENETPVICRLKNNGKNNPGNSVFGPTGVVCPGSHVTTQIINAIKDYCNNQKWEIKGNPKQAASMISGISNLDDVIINIL